MPAPDAIVRDPVRKRSPIRKRIGLLRTIPPREVMYPRRVVTALRVKPYTKLSYEHLVNLWELGRAAPPGAFVECGVMNGGSAAMLAAADSTRALWLFDSWEGLPQPGEFDINAAGETRPAGRNRGEIETVRSQIPYASLVKGWFHETIPTTKHQIGPVALLHLDCDWYDSVRLCLAELYEQVTPGGFVVIDDYTNWAGARKAVDEFDPPALHTTGDEEGGAWWQKPAH